MLNKAHSFISDYPLNSFYMALNKKGFLNYVFSNAID